MNTGHNSSFHVKILSILFLGIVMLCLRLGIARLGHNNDLISWYNVAGIVRTGNSPYNSTQFYNYGPWWGYTLSSLSQLNRLIAPENIVTFHYAVVVFLTCIDILIALLLLTRFGYLISIFHLLNPTASLLVGFHSQFENLAILLGFASFLLIISSSTKLVKRHYVLSAILMGLSISTKHLLLLFPLWILFNTKIKLSINLKIKYVLLAYFTFAVSFWIEIVRFNSQSDSIIRGIVDHVFKYGSSQGITAWVNIINQFIPLSQFINAYIPNIVIGTYTVIYLLVLLLSSIFIASKITNTKLLLPIYLLVSFSFLPGFADQYLSVVLLPASIFFNNFLIFAFQISSFSYLAFGPSANISNLVPFSLQFQVFNITLPTYPWGFHMKFPVLSAQAIILLFTILYLKKINEKS